MTSAPGSLNPAQMNCVELWSISSIQMKTLERVVLGHLHSMVSSAMDPLQFTNWPAIYLSPGEAQHRCEKVVLWLVGGMDP